MSLFEDAVERANQKRAQWERTRRPTPPKQNRLRWFDPQEEPAELTIRSPLEWWYTHWDVASRRSRRCGGEGCISCAEGQAVGIRYVLAVEDLGALVWLLELRERHAPFLDSLREHPSGQIGARIRVFRAWKAKNAPINLELIDFRAVTPIELSRVVRTLGLPAQRSYKPE